MAPLAPITVPSAAVAHGHGKPAGKDANPKTGTAVPGPPVKNTNIHAHNIISSTSIAKKVTQCLAQLFPEPEQSGRRTNTATTSRPGTQNGRLGTANSAKNSNTGSSNKASSEPKKPIIITLTAKSVTASKAITICEILKRRISERGLHWYQYCALDEVLEDVKPPKQAQPIPVPPAEKPPTGPLEDPRRRTSGGLIMFGTGASGRSTPDRRTSPQPGRAGAASPSPLRSRTSLSSLKAPPSIRPSVSNSSLRSSQGQHLTRVSPGPSASAAHPHALATPLSPSKRSYGSLGSGQGPTSPSRHPTRRSLSAVVTPSTHGSRRLVSNSGDGGPGSSSGGSTPPTVAAGAEDDDDGFVLSVGVQDDPFSAASSPARSQHSSGSVSPTLSPVPEKRAVPVLTIYLAMERIEEYKKLHGEQTNAPPPGEQKQKKPQKTQKPQKPKR